MANVQRIMERQWAEVGALGFIVLGFIISFVILSPVLSYFTIFLSGAVAGRIFYQKRYTEPIFPFVLLIVGFLVGYFIGTVWANRIGVLVFFGAGFMISYYLHWKEIVVTFKSENFVK